jgi:hypothetical protein
MLVLLHLINSRTCPMEMHSRVALGLARPPRVPIYLIERPGSEELEVDNKINRCMFNDWVDGSFSLP